MKIYFYIISFISLLILSCSTVNEAKKTTLKSNEFDVWILNAQEMTNRGRYLEAINLLNEALIKFPDQEILSINYNIGFNYYKLKKYDDAKKYFNRVINLFENNPIKDQNELNENRKYIVLAGVMIEKMSKDAESRKDPYHIKEDINDDKKVKKAKPKS